MGWAVTAGAGARASTGPAAFGRGRGIGRAVASRWPLLAVVVVGLAIRLVAAARLPMHVDEPHTLLAIRAVAEEGWPLLPSGVLYLQGATLSFLLAPLVWLGRGEIGDLGVLRLVSVLAGTAAVGLTYGVARSLSGSRLAALIAGGLIALDPLSVQWSAHLRMYAPVQAAAVAVVWCFVAALRHGGDGEVGRQRARLAGLVVAFWLAVFSQVAAALLWPAMLGSLLVVHGRRLAADGRGVLLAVVACLGAPVALLAANGLLGIGSGTAEDGPAKKSWLPSFVGDHHLDGGQLLAPDFSGWAGLFAGSALAPLGPLLVVVCSGYLLANARRRGGGAGARPAQAFVLVLVVVVLYWVPVVLAALLVGEPRARYLIFLQPLGYVIVAVVVARLVGRPSVGRMRSGGGRPDPRPRSPAGERGAGGARAGAVAVAAVALWVGHLGVGLATLPRWGTWAGPSHVPALRYVAANHRAGEPIVVALPPVASLVLGDRAELRFLAGEAGSTRSERYTRRLADGRLIDYWIGMEALGSAADLCGLLAARPGAWLVADELRLTDGGWYGATISGIVAGATEEVFRSGDGAVVRRAVPVERWGDAARAGCGGSMRFYVD